MSLFKKLADLARESNERWLEKELRTQQSEMREERAYEKKLALRNVCGNCPYYDYGKCIKHGFRFSPDELRDEGNMKERVMISLDISIKEGVWDLLLVQ